MRSEDSKMHSELKKRYLEKAIEEYEYSFAGEYDKVRITPKAASEGTVDFEYHNAEADVEISQGGAWVNARVWVPKRWLEP